MEFLPRKRRHCTGVRKADSEFCGAHQKLGRIPCPVDTTHTIFACDVDRHVPRCTRTTANARMQGLPCFAPGSNAGYAPCAEECVIANWQRSWDHVSAVPAAMPHSGSTSADIPLHAAADTLALTRMLAHFDLAAFATRVEAWWTDHCADQVGRGDSKVCVEELPPETLLPSATYGRHERQARLIVRAMERAGIFGRGAPSIGKSPLLVEFGAGKGLLGATAQLAIMRTHPSSQLILVERGANRSKADHLVLHAQQQTPTHFCQRIRMDIVDFDLSRHPSAWGVPLSDLVHLPEWINAAGHDHAAEKRGSAARGEVSNYAGDSAESATTSGKRRRPSYEDSSRDSDKAVSAGLAGDDNSRITKEPSPPTLGTSARGTLVPGDSGGACIPTAFPSATATPAPRSEASICAIGKHLCGGATDLALRCVARATVGDLVTRSAAGDSGSTTGDGALGVEVPSLAVDATCGGPPTGDASGSRGFSIAPPPGISGPPPRLSGIAIATCCHHTCSWAAYVGKGLVRDVLHAGPVEFEAMRMLSAWGCMPLQPPALPQEVAAPAATSGSDALPLTPGSDPVSFDRAARVALGRRCKSLIDAGRAWFLRELHGCCSVKGTVKVVPYCPGSDSPENMLLLMGGACL